MNGEVYADDMIEVDVSSPATHFERYRSLIDSFDEDRENWFEKLIRWFFLLMAYTLPLVVAYAMGREIGDAYGGSFNWSDGWSLGTHTVAMAGEFALAMMTLSAAAALRRMTQDSSLCTEVHWILCDLPGVFAGFWPGAVVHRLLSYRTS